MKCVDQTLFVEIKSDLCLYCAHLLKYFRDVAKLLLASCTEFVFSFLQHTECFFIFHFRNFGTGGN